MVLVRREHHPLLGKQLLVYGWMRRHGRLDLILVLPDGSKSLVPASWTDLDPQIVSAIRQNRPAKIGLKPAI